MPPPGDGDTACRLDDVADVACSIACCFTNAALSLANGTNSSCTASASSDTTKPTISSGATMRASEMPPALNAVISLSPESRCIASSVPSSIAIGITSSRNCGMSHRKYSTAAHSGACSSVTSRPIARICVATKISVNADSPNMNGPPSSATRYRSMIVGRQRRARRRVPQLPGVGHSRKLSPR